MYVSIWAEKLIIDATIYVGLSYVTCLKFCTVVGTFRACLGLLWSPNMFVLGMHGPLREIVSVMNVVTAYGTPVF